ncbi:TRAP transporter small permease subunit [Maritalea mediterranea]|uniref:TRAP transporter small permease protein n=1 Tax=Maritalea mediterranea TaxID=2909667 RepID=A0ABS9E8U5_9HYPH|nr:TRAP transporter small permease subunit [Maritalea mediterranea]MCF4099296.1 TRAP transporter small permease subunit [Maritalea mediterranea]
MTTKIDIEHPEKVAEAPRLAYIDDLPTTAFSRPVDRALRAIGRSVSWVWLLLLAVIVINVVARYVFGKGRIEFEEIQWHFYAIGFMIGLSYCLTSDDHIRVDVVAELLSNKTKAWVETLGLVFLLIPFLVFVLIYAVPFFTYSFSINETSGSPGGLPARWAIKSVLIIGFALLLLAAVSRLTRTIAFLRGKSDADQANAGGTDNGH